MRENISISNIIGSIIGVIIFISLSLLSMNRFEDTFFYTVPNFKNTVEGKELSCKISSETNASFTYNSDKSFSINMPYEGKNIAINGTYTISEQKGETNINSQIKSVFVNGVKAPLNSLDVMADPNYRQKINIKYKDKKVVVSNVTNEGSKDSINFTCTPLEKQKSHLAMSFLFGGGWVIRTPAPGLPRLTI